jgi:hypothetical protein
MAPGLREAGDPPSVPLLRARVRGGTAALAFRVDARTPRPTVREPISRQVAATWREYWRRRRVIPGGAWLPGRGLRARHRDRASQVVQSWPTLGSAFSGAFRYSGGHPLLASCNPPARPSPPVGDRGVPTAGAAGGDRGAILRTARRWLHSRVWATLASCSAAVVRPANPVDRLPRPGVGAGAPPDFYQFQSAHFNVAGQARLSAAACWPFLLLCMAPDGSVAAARPRPLPDRWRVSGLAQRSSSQRPATVKPLRPRGTDAARGQR